MPQKLSELAAEILEIEERSQRRTPPPADNARWSELIGRLIKRLSRGQEARRWLRIPVHADAIMTCDGKTVTAQIANVSNGGLGLLTPYSDMLSGPATLCSVSFGDEVYEQSAACSIAWNDSLDDWTSLPTGMTFVDLARMDRKKFYPFYYVAYKAYLQELASIDEARP